MNTFPLNHEPPRQQGTALLLPTADGFDRHSSAFRTRKIGLFTMSFTPELPSPVE